MLDLINLAVYGGLAVVAVAYWARRHTEPAAWLAATFTTLGLVVLLSAVGPDTGDPATPPPQFSALEIRTDVVSVVLLTFPYLLYRFARSLRPGAPGAVARTVDGAMLAIAVGMFLLPPLGGEDPPTFVNVVVLLLLSWWGGLLFWSATSMFRAGAGRPGVVRKRMRLMAVAASLMALALLATSALEAVLGETGRQVLSATLGFASAGGFLIAFEPPGVLRRLWRGREEEAQREAERGLVSALTATEAAGAIVDTARALVGGEAAEVLDADGTRLAVSGDVDAFTADGVTREEIVLDVRSPTSRVRVFRSPVTPMFGSGEEELLHQLCGHLDLALARVQAMDDREHALRQLERANTELTQLVYGVSHDLRNPLVTVLGFLGLMEDDEGQLSETQAVALERITISARYMEGLIDDLLQLSRVGRTDSTPSPVDLHKLSGDIAEDLQVRYPDLRPTVSCRSVVSINPLRARQLLTNLMENAARHGRVAPLELQVTSQLLADGRLAVDVTDNGVGIPEADRARVFEIFQRLEGFDASSKGSGIGLTMCRRIAEDLGGSLELVEVPSGTTFRVELPAERVVSHTPSTPLAHSRTSQQE